MIQSSPYVIRPMEPDDIPTVVAIDRISFPSPWRESSYLYELHRNPQSAYYVLLEPTAGVGEGFKAGNSRWLRWLDRALNRREKPDVIGYVGFRFERAEAHISTIAVHPDWRGRSLGELLLVTAIEEALELDMQVISLEVRPSNMVAQRLYRKYGFQFTGIRHGYYRDGESAWLMALELNSKGYRKHLDRLSRELMTAIRHTAPSVSV